MSEEGLRTHPRHGVVTADGLVLCGELDEVRAIDRHAIEVLGIPGRLLMELAGQAAVERVMGRLGGQPGRAVVLCGPGNNGGDGYVVARHLLSAGWKVRVIATATPGADTDAGANHALLLRLGGLVEPLGPRLMARHSHHLNHANLIVDALFGTGLGRAPEPPVQDLIACANAAPHALRLALDIPSGLSGHRGEVLGAAIDAHLTIGFGLDKVGLLHGDGPEQVGERITVPIGWPLAAVEAVRPSLRRPLPAWVASRLPRRHAGGHKGSYGHVAIVGGSEGKEGAAILAGLGALRAGAGLCTWVRHGVSPERPPELMAHDAGTGAGLLPERASVLVVGPGLGEAPGLCAAALADARPRVLDADALTAERLEGLMAPETAVLTPHPLEAARLLGTRTEVVQGDRVAAARDIALKTGAVTLLKGRNPIVVEPAGRTFILEIAEPLLSAGGTGDVLAGLIGALMGQGLGPFEAAVVGAEVHARAAREAAAEGQDRGVLASEIAAGIPGAMHHLAAGWAAP